MKTKPFNIEEAKAGKPVVTRDYLPVRILCFDRKGFEDLGMKIVALVEDLDGVELIGEYHPNGHYLLGEDDPKDLMMVCEPKTGWVNIYRNTISPSGFATGEIIYDSEEKAISARGTAAVATTKIEWLE